MNGSMFLPQMTESDVYDINGHQTDDINTVLEYIRVQLGYDKTADDEDDDSGQNFQVASGVDYFYEPHLFEIEQQPFAETTERVYQEYINTKLTFISFDIITPPPEA